MGAVLRSQGAAIRRTEVNGNSADGRGGRFFVDFTGSFHETSLYGTICAIFCVEDCMRLKMTRFSPLTSDVTAALGDIIDAHIASVNRKLAIIRTAERSSPGRSGPSSPSSTFDTSARTRACPSIPGSSSGPRACYAAGLYRTSTKILEGITDRLWAELMWYACDISNQQATTSVDKGATSYYSSHGPSPSF